jgi:hypothetical protein
MDCGARVLASAILVALGAFAQQSKGHAGTEAALEPFKAALNQVMTAAEGNFQSIVGRPGAGHYRQFHTTVTLPGLECRIMDRAKWMTEKVEPSDILVYSCSQIGGSGDFRPAKSQYEQLVKWVRLATGLESYDERLGAVLVEQVETHPGSGEFEGEQGIVFYRAHYSRDPRTGFFKEDVPRRIEGPYVEVNLSGNLGRGWSVSLMVGSHWGNEPLK